MAFKKGNIPWNLRKTYKNPKISLFNKGKHYSVKTEIKKGQRLSPKTEFKKELVPWNKGKRGVQVAWNKGKKTGLAPWLGKKRNQETRDKISQANMGRIAWSKGKKRPEISGENNPAWKGGVTSVHTALRHSFEYEEWRKKVFERDLYTCQECGQVGGYLHADHIKRFADYPELRFELSNGQTLCIDCHKLKTIEEAKQYWKNQFSEV